MQIERIQVLSSRATVTVSGGVQGWGGLGGLELGLNRGDTEGAEKRTPGITSLI